MPKRLGGFYIHLPVFPGSRCVCSEHMVVEAPPNKIPCFQKMSAKSASQDFCEDGVSSACNMQAARYLVQSELEDPNVLA